MLVLFEMAAGYALYELHDEKKLREVDNLYKDFESPETASNVLKLKKFIKFRDTTEALAAAAATVEGKMSKTLKKLLKKVAAETHETLAVADAKLGNAIKDKLNLECVYNSNVQELMRCIRSQAAALIPGLPAKEMSAMALGLAHSLGRYKLKFSPDKVDTMIVQAISVLDDADKELNNYCMRARELYGWHFPELGKIITDNLAYVKTVKAVGYKTNAKDCDLSEILPEEVEKEVKENAEISMGTEINEDDLTNIVHLCDQVIAYTDHRASLYDYIKHRMMAVAPNLTILVGELVGARLMAHAGSLLNLAKHPASTVQILGAEKALFRALKTKHDTPKYGLIYHASLVGQCNPKMKGKISRMLAAKVSLAVRVDALGEDGNTSLGVDHLAKLQKNLRLMEEGSSRKITGSGKDKAKFDKYENRSEVKTFSLDEDSTLSKKRKPDETPNGSDEPKAKKIKKEKVEEVDVKDESMEDADTPQKKKKDKKAAKLDTTTDIESSEKKKKKKKKKESDEEDC